MSSTRTSALADLQSHVRRFLREFDRVATEAGIPYFLAYGTALGAVRDGDLIPWDPDADVWVASEHHPRLVEACERLLGDEFELLAPETHSDYEYLFPRLALRGTHHVLLSLDVFPLDPAPSSVRGRQRHLRRARFLCQVFLVKRADTAVRVHYSLRKRLLARLLRVLALPVPAAVVLRAFRRLQARHVGARSDVLVNSCGSYGEREVFEASWFDITATKPVGDLSLPVPGAYDELLTRLYGDYLVPVPVERQQQEIEHATATFVAPLLRPGALLGPAEGRHRRPA